MMEIENHYLADTTVVTIADHIHLCIYATINRWRYDEKEDIWIVSKYLFTRYLTLQREKN